MVNLFAELYEVISSSQYISRPDQFFIISLFFLERTAKALPRFLLDEERKKASASPVFLFFHYCY